MKRRKSVPLPTLEEEMEAAAACIRTLTRHCVKRQEHVWGSGPLPDEKEKARHRTGVDFWCGVWATFDELAGKESPFTQGAAAMAAEVARDGGYSEMKGLLEAYDARRKH